MGFFAFSSALLFLLIPPLVLLYFLKLKRPRLDVPSLVLWRQVLNDNRVNSPFQKFKRHILLWLQLLLLCLLVLAAMQPYFRGGADRATNLPVLIDHSASMAATDASGLARLDAAKEQIRNLIDNLQPDHRLSLIAFAGSARKLTGFTDNPRILHDALDNIVIQDVPSDIEDALRVAQAMAQRTIFDEALMYSDGNFPAVADFALPFRLSFQKLDPAGPNAGVTALSAKRAGEGRWDVFVGLSASSDEPVRGTLTIALDGEGVGSEFVTIARDTPQRILFPVATQNAARIAVRFEPESADSLVVDNRAYLEVDPARRLRVAVPDTLRAYRMAIEPLPGIELVDDPAAADLLITEDALVATEAMTPVSLSVGVVPEDVQPLLTVGDEGTAVVDWRRNDAVLSHVDWTDLTVIDSPVSNEDVRESDYENLGYEVLVHGREGPLLLRKREGDRVSFHMLFHSDRSTLPYRVGFPIMLQNLTRIAMTKAGLLEARGNPTGVLPPQIGLTPETTFDIAAPRGGDREMASNRFGVLSGVPAPRVGVYTISGGGDAREVTASLLNTEETRLDSVDAIQFNELTVAAAAKPVEVDRPLWRWLALIGLAVLMIEWWYFQRRPAGLRGAPTRE